MSRKSGRVAVLQIQTDGAGGSAGWNTVTVKRNLRVTVETQAQDASASESVDVVIPGPHKITITGELMKNPDDTEYAALQAAHAARTTLGFWELDQAGSGGKGWKFDGVITRFEDTGNRGDSQMTSITIEPAPSSTDPAYSTVA